MRKKRKDSDELQAPLPTLIGISIILAVIGFIGFVKPKHIQEQERARQSLQESSITQKSVYVPESGSEDTMVESSELHAKNVGPTLEKKEGPTLNQPFFPADGPPRNPLIHPGNISSLPFGRDAVDRCSASCQGGGSNEKCNLNCRRLISSEFARRIVKEELDPSKSARETKERCKQVGWNSKAHFSLEDKDALLALIEPPQTFEKEKLLERFQRAGRFFTALVPDKKEQSNAISQSVCLLEAAITAELAISEAADNSDSFSEMFYRHFESELIDSIITLKPELEKKL